jgi:MOB kinase activator 1
MLSFLSPRAAKVLSAVCTLTESTSSMTICKADEDEEDDTLAEVSDAQFRTSYSYRGYNSNQRTRNQFRPRNTTKGTTSYQLRQYAEATLGGGSLKKIVKLPDGEDENEWLAVNSKGRKMEGWNIWAYQIHSGRLLQPH